MAANKYKFLAQALVTNGQSVGGLARISFAPRYRDVVVSRGSGAAGAEDVDRAGLEIGVTIECEDVKKAAAILNADPGDTTFYERESGAATYTKYELLTASAGEIVYTGMNLQLATNADPRLTLTGKIRPYDGTKTWEDMLKTTEGQTAPSLTTPDRIFKPHNTSFDPDGAAAAIAPINMRSIGLALSAVDIPGAYGDTDKAVTMVERGEWGALRVTLGHGDGSKPAAQNSHINAALLSAEWGVLTADLEGRGGGAEQVLTVNNLVWTEAPEEHRDQAAQFTLQGAAGWKRSTTTYGLVSTPLFAFANKA